MAVVVGGANRSHVMMGALLLLAVVAGHASATAVSLGEEFKIEGTCNNCVYVSRAGTGEGGRSGEGGRGRLAGPCCSTDHHIGFASSCPALVVLQPAGVLEDATIQTLTHTHTHKHTFMLFQ